MLDIRATSYISPLAEVPFASVALTVRLVNAANETSLVSGVFRIYNDNTGSLIHTSRIQPVYLAAGDTLDVSALTDFDPPAPADDVYFVTFDGHAVNALIPRAIDFSLGAHHFDVKPTGMGPAPAAHHATHETGGSDEVDVTDLAGVLADPQTPAAHHTTHETAGADIVQALPVGSVYITTLADNPLAILGYGIWVPAAPIVPFNTWERTA